MTTKRRQIRISLVFEKVDADDLPDSVINGIADRLVQYANEEFADVGEVYAVRSVGEDVIVTIQTSGPEANRPEVH